MSIKDYIFGENAKQLKEAKITMDQIRTMMDSTFGVQVNVGNGDAKPEAANTICKSNS